VSQQAKAKWFVRLLTGLSRLPLPMVHGLGWFLGHLYFVFPSRDRRVTWKNLSIAFPTMSSWQRFNLMRLFFVELGKTACELGWMWVAKPEALFAQIKQVKGLHLMEQALSQQKGVLLLTPHFGAWELAGLFWASTQGMASLYQPSDYAEIEDFVRGARQRTGARLVPTDISGVRALLSTLKQNQIAGILPDQDPGDNGGEYAPFFGLPAYTMVLTGRLASKSQAPVLFTWAERLSWGRGYCLHVLPASEAIASADLGESARAMNADIAQYVALCPQQYIWNYKRWKRQADGSDVYD
jgi:Kdo2-lipid IVA lauroyltransferase/acyltransferase